MMKRTRSKWIVPASLVLLAACGGSANSDGKEAVKLVLNWFPKSQMGGFYAAQVNGDYEDNGLDVEIEPGGPEVSAIQLVASGNADFGLAHADQLLVARNEGIEFIALAATQQESPQALMFHEGKGVSKFEGINGKTMYIEPGIPYWDYLKSQYDLSEVEELAYTGQNVNFLANEDSITQAFQTSEPFFLERQGVATETMLISEAGYNPYNVVLFVTKDYFDKNEETVDQFMKAYQSGWETYETNYDDINETIHEVNPEIAMEELEFEAEAQYEFVFGGDAEEHGVGYMSHERWQELIDQLVDIGQLDQTVDAAEVFTTKYYD
ncbi:ABC transporter substrate-binding protein [Shouchella patagoniensis]|uniref:ABC transporter substrate-binding protein n=1 Tax=Shouchella patagoniensis TaxID=228576 RepID=UPI000995011C|nr:ABC transporter substrate-binding protein [Shouchella patagoniensis]